MVVVLITCISAPLSASTSKSGDHTGGSPGQPDLRVALRNLDKLIEASPRLASEKQASLQALAREMADADGKRKCEIALELANKYRIFDADSSLFFANKGCALSQRLGNSDLQLNARLVRIKSLATLGIFSDAKADFMEIDGATVPEELKEDYFFTGRTLYGYIQTYLNDASEFYEMARKLNRAYDDSLIAMLPTNSNLRDFLLGEKYVNESRYSEAEALQLSLIKRINHKDPLYAMTTFQAAMTYRRLGESQMTGYYLTLAAQADIEGCVRDGLALPMLASWLYKEGKVDEAYQYINVALNEANEGSLRWRTFAMAAMVPTIDRAYRRQMKSSHDKLVVYSIIMTLCMLFCVCMAFFLFRQRRRAHEIALKLASTSALQNSYIGNFVAMCSSYADRLNKLSATVDRKLSAGQVDELKKMVKNGKLIEGNDEDFYSIFDSAFLDLYPGFVDELNGLLREEDRLEWRKGQSLSPELRIYALVRLGVSESTRISQILHYSVSTVYAYRNRMRNRAIERESFERDIMTLATHPVEGL